MLRDPISKLIVHEGFGGNRKLDGADAVELSYKGYCEILANQLTQACNAMDATAEALREIVDLYRPRRRPNLRGNHG